jgi:hypothetical protein
MSQSEPVGQISWRSWRCKAAIGGAVVRRKMYIRTITAMGEASDVDDKTQTGDHR